MINFNFPYITGKEHEYINDAINVGHISGNGKYTKLCQSYLKNKFGFKKCLLTTSCTDALEMAALLLDIKTGDEIIIPSFTFVSTALAFVRQGAKIVFVDSRQDHPGIDESKIEKFITSKTKAIVVVHYAGVACDMDKIIEIANKYKLFIVEDAAQAIDSYYNGKPLGSLGHLSCFSFHETKNIQCGEGGMLVINDEQFANRAEIIWEKGTNRAAFFRGEIDKYGWVDIGSSFLPSEICAAFLYAQVENMEVIQNKRKWIWNYYDSALRSKLDSKGVKIPVIPDYATNNGHMYYIVCSSTEERQSLIEYMKSEKIFCVFHYQSLHKSSYNLKTSSLIDLPHSDYYAERLVRLPFYFSLNETVLNEIILKLLKFYK
ncbi:MAG: dTDP-4-amino-4,6-dideoxygalactose transaminase [Bacteroidia bacterium]|nr:dTDP-4-amino-4,6-dideoxygalactose transaminase [Bacteroidia bacterium]